MADDIVTRLREKYQGQLPICTEAADEIERLRIKVKYLKTPCPRCDYEDTNDR